MSILKGIMAAAMALGVLTGSASMNAVDGSQNLNDPFEGFNRAMFVGTLAADRVVLRPTAVAYRAVVPRLLRDSVRNFLNNLDTPAILANDVLQGEVNRAGVTLLRAGVNTTIGLGGLIDMATRLGYERHNEDFGQTLAVYGLDEGPYIFVPLLGPGNPRDIVGWIVDFLFDPLNYVQLREKYYWRTGKSVVDFTDLRERNIENLDEIEKTSLDYYASARSLYRQSRSTEISNATPEVQELPDF